MVSDRAIPIQGMYGASKHAVKGFTDALRMELEEEGVPVSVTLVKPGSIDTPFPQHARNYMDEEPTLPPPVYAPDVVAAGDPALRRDPRAGRDRGRRREGHRRHGDAPRIADKVMGPPCPEPRRRAAAPKPGGCPARPDLRAERSGAIIPAIVLKSSAYTAATLHPVWTGLLAAGAGLAIAALVVGTPSKGRRG